MKSHPLDLCSKRDQFSQISDRPGAHRTSNRVDRLMKFGDRAFFHAQYCHGLSDSAESRVRALAFLWNFCPASPQTVCKHAGQACPAARLSGKRYADNWLENLLVSWPDERCRARSTESVIIRKSWRATAALHWLVSPGYRPTTPTIRTTIRSPYSAPCAPSTIRAYRLALAARCQYDRPFSYLRAERVDQRTRFSCQCRA